MPRELKDILAELTEYTGDDEDKVQEAANEIHKQHAAVAQVLIDRGGKGNRESAEAKKKLRDATRERDEARARVTEVEGELEDARTTKPEDQQRLQKELDRTKSQLQQANDALVKEKGDRVTDKRSGAVERFKKHTKPGQAGGVQEGYDEDLASKYGHLITYAEDGTQEIRKIDDPDAVYIPAKGQDALELLAADAVKKAPAWARLTGVEGGGGQGGGGGGGRGEKDLVDTKVEQFNTERSRQGENALVKKPAPVVTQ